MTRDTAATSAAARLARGPRSVRFARFVRSAARTAGLLGVVLAATFGYNTWAAIDASNPPTPTSSAGQADIDLTGFTQHPFTG